MGSRRKHIKQMSKRERDFLQATILALPRLTIERHCNHRMSQKGVSPEEVLNAIRFGKIIECHNNVRNDIRILVRHDRKGISTSVVISLLKNQVVTTYPNDANDKHFTLDWSVYKWTVNIEEEIKRFLARKERMTRNGQRGSKRYSHNNKKEAIL